MGILGTGRDQRNTSTRQFGRVIAGPVPEELIAPAKDGIGVRLLQKMGWRPGQGVGPRLTHRQWRREQKLRQSRRRGVPLFVCIVGCGSA
jgi:G patch domain-containing protein 1